MPVRTRSWKLRRKRKREVLTKAEPLIANENDSKHMLTYNKAKLAWKSRLSLLMGEVKTDSNAVCRNCKSGKDVTYHLVQTRAADEASTIFMTCSRCRTRWKV